jgi:glutamine---fructose-6-phosphate transaminase (isomerizing)
MDMGGILGLTSSGNLSAHLLHGLAQLAGDSAGAFGLAMLTSSPEAGCAQRLRRLGSTQGLHTLKHHLQFMDPLSKVDTAIAHTHKQAEGSTHNDCLPCFSQGPKAQLHTPARTAVVFMGQLHNAPELRAVLSHRAYPLRSLAESECIAHIIDATDQGDAAQAVQRALALVRGSYALAVLFQKHPQRIIAACSGLPLWLGVGPTSICVSSNPVACPAETQQLLRVHDGSMVDMQGMSFQILGPLVAPIHARLHHH